MYMYMCDTNVLMAKQLQNIMCRVKNDIGSSEMM